MKLDKVPQDKVDFKGRDTIKKVMYATDADGQYEAASSDGWDVEISATKQAWEAVESEIATIKKEVASGLSSPIKYFMAKCLFEPSVLAKYVGKWTWQVKRHFKPAVFAKLDEKMLSKYADVFGISVDELKHYNGND